MSGCRLQNFRNYRLFSIGKCKGLPGLRNFREPENGWFSLFYQVVIGLLKMPISKKSSTCRQRRWVGGSQNQMSVSIDYRAFFLGIASPEQKNQSIPPLRKQFHNGICKQLPSFVLMRARFPGFNG